MTATKQSRNARQVLVGSPLLHSPQRALASSRKATVLTTACFSRGIRSAVRPHSTRGGVQATYRCVFVTLMMILRNPAAAADPGGMPTRLPRSEAREAGGSRRGINLTDRLVWPSHRTRTQPVGELIRRLGGPDRDPMGITQSDLVRQRRRCHPNKRRSSFCATYTATEVAKSQPPWRFPEELSPLSWRTLKSACGPASEIGSMSK